MPVNYSIDSNQGLVHTVCEGDLVFDEVANHFRELGSDPAFVDQLNLLLELRADNVPTTQQVFNMIEPLRGAVGNRRFNRVAVVAFSEAWYGYARMFDAASSGFFMEPRVFSDLDTARAWIEDGG